MPLITRQMMSEGTVVILTALIKEATKNNLQTVIVILVQTVKKRLNTTR
jgi:hypothetical protein